MINNILPEDQIAAGERRVMVFGTFDIFHEGHKDFFRQARLHGNKLIVVVARDKNVLEIKKKLPQNDEIFRQKKISESGLADTVVLGDKSDRYKIIKEFNPDIICLGYDQKADEEALKARLKEFGLAKTQIIRLNPFRPEIYKSSKLRTK